MYKGNEVLAKAAYGALECRPISIRERLTRDMEAMLFRVAEIKEAIALLDRNPDFEKLQNLIR